jgi:uncharacterized protein YdeI (BOF family)
MKKLTLIATAAFLMATPVMAQSYGSNYSYALNQWQAKQTEANSAQAAAQSNTATDAAQTAKTVQPAQAPVTATAIAGFH